MEATTISAAEGGTVASEDGLLQLHIQPGVLPSDTAVTIRRLGEGELPDEVRAIAGEKAAGYELRPDGLELNGPVLVTWDLSASELGEQASSGTPGLVVVGTLPDGSIGPTSGAVTSRVRGSDRIRLEFEIGELGPLSWRYSQVRVGLGGNIDAPMAVRSPFEGTSWADFDHAHEGAKSHHDGFTFTRIRASGPLTIETSSLRETLLGATPPTTQPGVRLTDTTRLTCKEPGAGALTLTAIAQVDDRVLIGVVYEAPIMCGQS